jgi:hypothetical protein
LHAKRSFFIAVTILLVGSLAAAPATTFAADSMAASDFTHLRIRSVSSTMDSASQIVTFDVVRVGDTPLVLAGRSMTIRDGRGRVRTAVLDADSDRTSSSTVVAYSNVFYPKDEDTGNGFDIPPEYLWLPPRFLPVEGGTLAVEGMDEWSFGPLPQDGGALLRDGTVVSLPAAERNTQRLLVREYYHAGMDHYFLTANAAEFDVLDFGDVPGWRPTGVIHYAYAGKPAPEYVPVCRLLFLYPSGYSHFMSNFSGECEAIATSGAAILETTEAFYMAASDGASCPGTHIIYSNGSESFGSTGVPIYRLWNGKAEANHRYVIEKAERDAMVARGWVSEGAGPDGVVMCGYVIDADVFN